MDSPPEWLQTALGYQELKMFDDAWQALNSLPDQHQNTIHCLSLRVTCRIDEQRYEEAIEWCQMLCDLFPSEHVGYIQGAYCLHAIGKTEAARAWLQSGPFSLQVEPIYFYNLGCYDLALGLEESACSWLMQAFELEPAYYDDALKDPDFTDILSRIKTMRKEDKDGFLN